jgi:crotonobetainyl-CoA:carnitine CoA-transferase CaiB-like acyl-CoA transferase
MSNGSLDGLVVLDLTRVLAGPLSTMLLGDMGAEVIKIERPGTGDDTRGWGPPFVGSESAYYLGVNRNKRSLTLDLSTEEGRDILRRLVPLADVVIDNFKMGTLDRWGLDDDWYSRHAPRVVRCTISGYGSTGPKAGMPGYDFILQAESGLMSITGEPDGASMKLGVAIVDICTGLLATISVLAALTARQSTGRGQQAEVNLHDTGLLMLANVAANHLSSGDMPGRYGNGHPNIVPYRTFEASDGEVAVAVGNDDQFRKLAALLDSPEWADDPRFARNRDRVEHRELIDDLIQRKFSMRTRSEWIEALDRVGIPSGPINNVAEALSSPQTQARDMVTTVDHPLLGLVRMLGLPIRFDRTPATIRSHPPGLGEHTTEILGEMLGMESPEIDDLRSRGVV